MADNYAKDIIRIVGIDNAQSVLGEAAIKANIPSKRGIAYFAPDSRNTNSLSGFGAGSSGTTGFESATQLQDDSDSNNIDSSGGDSDVDPNTDPSSDDIEADGGPPVLIDPLNPRSAIIRQDQGEYDAEDIIDQPGDGKFPTPTEEYKSGVNEKLVTAGGTLTSLVGLVDCATGTDINIRTVGGYKPPEGWEDPDVAPPAYTFIPGNRYFWTTETVGAAVAETAHELAATKSGVVWGSVYETAFLYVSAHPTIEDRFTAHYDPDILGPELVTEHDISLDSCTIDSDDSCPSVDPTDGPVWPSDGIVQIKLVDGKFVSSEFEHPDDIVPQFTGDGVSHIDFCFGFGGSRTGTLVPTHSGGFLMYETSGGSPTGIVTVFSSQGTVLGFTDPAGVNGYIVK